MAAKLNIPCNYLGKTLQKLARVRILESQKGQHGGFRCDRHPSKVTLYDLLTAVDAIPITLDRRDDVDLPPSFHARFRIIKQSYERFLRETSIQDLVETQAEPAKPAEPTPATVAEALMAT